MNVGAVKAYVLYVRKIEIKTSNLVKLKILKKMHKNKDGIQRKKKRRKEVARSCVFYKAQL